MKQLVSIGLALVLSLIPALSLAQYCEKVVVAAIESERGEEPCANAGERTNGESGFVHSTKINTTSIAP